MLLFWAANLLVWGEGNDTLLWGDAIAPTAPTGHRIQIAHRAPPIVRVKAKRRVVPEQPVIEQPLIARAMPDLPIPAMPQIDMAPIEQAIARERAMQAAHQQAVREQAAHQQAMQQQAAQQQAAAATEAMRFKPNAAQALRLALRELRNRPRVIPKVILHQHDANGVISASQLMEP